MPLLDEVLERYFAAQKELLVAEQMDDDNIIVSFPFHYVGHHRIEVSVTKSLNDRLLLSDMGRTIGQLKEYGYTVAPQLFARMEEIAKPARVRVVNGNLVMDCSPSEVGESLHGFAEAAKTIGDAYLAFRVKVPTERRLIDEIKRLFAEWQVAYKPAYKLRGHIDVHSVDFYIPPNGVPGLTINVLAGYNTHTQAQVWHFKAADIRAHNPRVKVGLIYDTEESTWSDNSQKILREVADVALPSEELSKLGEAVEKG